MHQAGDRDLRLVDLGLRDPEWIEADEFRHVEQTIGEFLLAHRDTGSDLRVGPYGVDLRGLENVGLPSLEPREDTRLIVLDEPTVHLDLRHQVDVLQLVESLADDTTQRTKMSFGKILKYTAIVLAVILVLGIVVLSVLDFSRFQPEIEAAVQDATGRDFSINGDFSVKVLPSPTVLVEDVTLSNASWGSEPDLLRVGHFSAKIGLWSLLSRPIVIHDLKLADVDVLLEVGPKPVLLGMGRHCVDDRGKAWLPSLRPGQPDGRRLR